MYVAFLYTYPIKGCHRVEQESAVVRPWGLVGDRRWLVIDEAGDAVTQREIAGLTGLVARTNEGGVQLSLAGQPDLTVAEPLVGPSVPVHVFEFNGRGVRAGDEADAWLSRAYGQPLRLVWLEDTGQRPIEPGVAQPGETFAFQDEYPVTLANLASLDALNDWIAESGSLEGPLPINRFRPNIVLAGATPWVEDTWNGGRLQVGEVVFRVARGVGRCTVTTTDQETGERGHEPLRSLGRHRNIGQKLLFSTHLVPDRLGVLRVGDPVTPL